MDLQLQGKNVLITGAGQGVGRELGQAFAAEGANVAFVYNSSSEGAEGAAAEARQSGVTAVAVQADITVAADVDRMVAQAAADLGPIDVLVNNAAFTATGPFLEFDPDDIDRMIDVTVGGTMRVTRAVVGHMMDTDVAGRGGGAIVSLMGDSGRVGESRLAPVAATRASTMALMKSVAKEFGRHGIRANTVSLGLVQSENFDHHTGHADDERMARIVRMYPAGRVGMPRDVPPMVMLLASPLSGWVTGQTVSLNGGYSMV